jgi:hypothetical protein
MSQYPDAPISALRTGCEQLLADAISIEDFQILVRLAEASLTSVEQRPLRELLRQAENELEEVLFTISSHKRRNPAVAIARRVADAVQ